MQINLDVAALKKMVEGQSTLDPSFLVKRIAPLEQAGPQDLSILFDPDEESIFEPISKDVVKNSNAGLILSSKPLVDGKQYLVVSDPLQAFHTIVNFVSLALGK